METYFKYQFFIEIFVHSDVFIFVEIYLRVSSPLCLHYTQKQALSPSIHNCLIQQI
jgi:hypothetical protein